MEIETADAGSDWQTEPFFLTRLVKGHAGAWDLHEELPMRFATEEAASLAGAVLSLVLPEDAGSADAIGGTPLIQVWRRERAQSARHCGRCTYDATLRLIVDEHLERRKLEQIRRERARDEMWRTVRGDAQ